MPTNSYDLIVIGDDFAGLVAGTLCARRGMRVLVLDGGRPDGYQLGPHRLPVQPLSLAGYTSPAVARVMDELNLTHTLKRQLQTRPVSFQFIMPNLRVDVTADDHMLTGELRRELDRSKDAVNRASRACTDSAPLAELFDEVMEADSEFPPTGFWKRREVGRNASRIAEESVAWFDSFASNDMLRALLTMPALASTYTGMHALNASACARSFHHWRLGAPRIRGDREALRELFGEKLTKSNGEKRSARIAEITFSWGRVNGVRLENGEDLGAGHVIAAMPLSQLLPLVERKPPKRLIQCAEAMATVGYRYTLNLVVDEAGVPEGMSSPVMLVADPTQPLIGDNAVAIYLDIPDEEARVGVTLAAVCPPPENDRPLSEALADLRLRLRTRLDMVMPFLADHILLAHSPHEPLPPEGLRVTAPRTLPVEPEPVWESTLEAALGVSAVPYSTGLKNLTIASSQVLPQLGLEGDFATGWSAARIASEGSGKKREYREVLASG